MKSKYIQLPPLPLELPAEAIEIIWLYARLSEKEQSLIREFIWRTLQKNSQDLDNTDVAKILKNSDAEVNPDVKEFIDLMKKW